MPLILLSFLAGILTILSPCILPVLPFVFARADRPFVSSTLPMLIGMAATFAGVATLAAVGGGWAVQANQFGRFAALALFFVFGATLVLPALADRLTRPIVALGNRISNRASVEKQGGVAASLALGAATGLLWAPCAGPILGLLLTTAALQGASLNTTLLLLAYGLGAATSLAVALLAGGRVFAAMKKSIGAGEWVRRALGIAVLAGVAAIALGLDTGLLTRLSAGSTQQLEQALLNRAHPSIAEAAAPETESAADVKALPVVGPFPSLAGGVDWLNSPPLTNEELLGKVVLVDFWTYSCINCLRALPYVRAWSEKYRDHGLVVIGVHAPEFAFERDPGNVRRAVRDLEIGYPVVLDNRYAIWRAFSNRYWPAHYFIDAKGQMRYRHFGEGKYDRAEQVIQQLLAEARVADVPSGLVNPRTEGVGAAPDKQALASPETYLGYKRRENFLSPQQGRDEAQSFTAPETLQRNQWALAGEWTVRSEHAALDRAGGSIRFRFHARDLHLVLAPGADGNPVRFRVTIDGKAPGAVRGMDIDEKGEGVVREQRLYQLIRGGGGDRTFEIEFLDAGVEAFAFTFG